MSHQDDIPEASPPQRPQTDAAAKPAGPGQQGGRKGRGPRRPKPAREGLPEGRGKNRDRGRRGDDRGRPRAAQPEGAVEPVANDPPPSRSVEIDGASWFVQARGSGRAGTGTAWAPLLLVGFFREQGSVAPEREALIVGRQLPDITDDQLESAYRTGTPPRSPASRAALFPEAGGKSAAREG